MENINEHDITKKMLDSIRNGKTPNVMNENIQNIQPIRVNTQLEQLDEHDMTKKMLGVINEFRNTPKLDLGNDVVKVEDDFLAEEAVKINEQVGSVDLKLYEVYPKDRNVIMVGVLDNSGIEFKFSKNEGSPYINIENMKLDSKTLEMVKRLEGYYENWLVDWSKKINEYTKSV